jgi:hypothetical protein
MKIKKMLAALSIAMLAGTASATIVTLNATADLSLAGINSNSIFAGDFYGEDDALPLSAPFTVATGDTFIYDLDFLGSQQLTVVGLSSVWPLVFTQNLNQISTISMTGTLDLLGADDSVVATATLTNSDGFIHIAQIFSGADFGSPASVTFSGFRYVGTVNSQDLNPRTYDHPSLYFSGQSVSLSEFGSTNVPEPGSLALMLMGLSVAGVVLKRRV